MRQVRNTHSLTHGGVKMVTTRTSVSSQSKMRKKVAHPKMRHVEGAGKTAKPAMKQASEPKGTHHGKTPKGKSGGAVSVKGQGGHVATHGGTRKKKRVTSDHVARAMHAIR